MCKNHVIIRLFNIRYYIKFNIIFNIDILNEKLTADNNDQFGGYTRSATVQPGIAYARTNIHQGYYVSRPFPPNVSFRFLKIQNDPPTIANANYYNIMTRPIFPQLPYISFLLPSASTSPSPIWHSGLSPYHYELIILPTNVRRC